MNKQLLCVILILLPFWLSAQTITNESIQKESRSLSEIQSASELLLEYEITRTQDFSTGLKIIREASLSSMDDIAEEVKTLLPESFSSEYIQFKQIGFTEQGLSHLITAESKTENKTELYTDFLAASHILGKEDLLQEYASKLRNSGFINATALEYNKNVLRSIKEKNALIITNGWEDTYPLLTLLKEEKKKSITVINVEWLYDANLRSIISHDLGITSPAFSNNPYSWINAITASAQTPVYYTFTLPNSELIKLQGELSPVGLVFKRGVLTFFEQKEQSLKAWKKFSKLNLVSSAGLSKNYIIPLTLLEQTLKDDKTEQGTLTQIKEYKAQLLSKHPELK